MAALRFISDFMTRINAEYSALLKDIYHFDIFWNENIEKIKSIDISKLKIMAFHIVASLDECSNIKTNGLMDLQKVLFEDTTLKKMLTKVGIIFDIANKQVFYNGKSYDIDYDKYQNDNELRETQNTLCAVARRVYYDYCVNGFLFNDNVIDYGTDIHKRPEFLLTLGKLFPAAHELDNYWKIHAKSYRIDFYVTINQVNKYSFGLDEQTDINDDMEIKKWMLSHAIDRINDNSEPKCLYVKDGTVVHANQIISISELKIY